MDANDLLSEYRDSVKHGASFPCCICQTLNFVSDVCSVSDVESLRTLEERSRYVDVDLMHTCPNLFTMLDKIWVCQDCRRCVEKGERPPCSAENGLKATWRSLPSPLLDLSIEELDILSFTQIFSVIHEQSTGDEGEDRPTKVLLLPLPIPVHDEGRPNSGAAKVSAVQGLHLLRPGQEHNVRAQQMSCALNYLLGHTKGKFTGKRALLKSLFEERSSGCRLTESNDAVPIGERFLQLKKRQQDNVHVTVLPILSDLETNARQIMYCGPLDRRTRDLFDPLEESGVDLNREQVITGKQWLVHRLKSMFKRGPSDDAVLILGLLLRLEMSWLDQIHRYDDTIVEGQLMKRKGTREYFMKKLRNICAMERCYGPATFSFSLTMNANSEHFLAAFISQNRETEVLNGVQVWDSTEEDKMLKLRRGKTKPNTGSGYFVHQKTEVEDASCRFHTHCKRTPLQDWSRL